MKIEEVSKQKFAEIKDDIVNWLNSKLEDDPDTIFKFSSEIKKEDQKYIIQNSDNFIIDKNKIINISDNTVNNEILIRPGRKYYNKLQKYPIENMGVISIINNKIDIQYNILIFIVGINILTFLGVFTH